jgi:hypothetical protein|tara:strand:+ start:5570 stop:5698 length:129 start_codon:yes stop_codon:yes gene_type:complete
MDVFRVPGRVRKRSIAMDGQESQKSFLAGNKEIKATSRIDAD